MEYKTMRYYIVCNTERCQTSNLIERKIKDIAIRNFSSIEYKIVKAIRHYTLNIYSSSVEYKTIRYYVKWNTES